MSSLHELPDLTGFFSYSRRDDEHSQGALSDLRRQIYNELRLQLGSELKLWQDTMAIPEGALWESAIQRAISESVFFIPIVTPSSVGSKHCRFEFEAFLDREQALGRENLVFPLLYVRVPALEKEELWRQDDVLRIIGRRQYIDWREFRHRSFAEAEIKKKIEHFCGKIVASLEQPWIPPADRRAAEEAQAQAERIAEQARRDQEDKKRQKATEARQQQRRAAERAEAQRIAKEARRDQEEKKHQQAEAETRQKAERQRRAAAEAEARRAADQANQAAAEEWQHQRKVLEGEGRLRQGGSTQSQAALKSRAVAFIAFVLGVMLFFYILR
jgi:flagellar biosynthesis GTPase FlhF